MNNSVHVQPFKLEASTLSNIGLLFSLPELIESSKNDTCSGKVLYICLISEATSKRAASRVTVFLNDKLIRPYPFPETDETSFIPLTPLNNASNFVVTSCSMTRAEASGQR